MKTSIIIPVVNQQAVTAQCVASIVDNTHVEYELIIIDNASDHATASYLDTLNAVVKHNPNNCGCAGAWNQGLDLARGDYVCIVNNDILVPKGWLGRLQQFSKETSLALVSPAMREGILDYDFGAFSEQFQSRWTSKSFRGEFLGTCFAGPRSTFDTVGRFDEAFRYGKFEDEDFYFRMRECGLEAGITFDVLIHHFGSLTVNAAKKELGHFEAENRRTFHKKWRHKYLYRKFRKWNIRRHHRMMTRAIRQVHFSKTGREHGCGLKCFL